MEYELERQANEIRSHVRHGKLEERSPSRVLGRSRPAQAIILFDVFVISRRVQWRKWTLPTLRPAGEFDVVNRSAWAFMG